MTGGSVRDGVCARGGGQQCQQNITNEARGTVHCSLVNGGGERLDHSGGYSRVTGADDTAQGPTLRSMVWCCGQEPRSIGGGCR